MVVNFQNLQQAKELGVAKISVVKIDEAVPVSAELIKQAVAELKKLFLKYRCVLVQCTRGESRSPAVVAAYLASCSSSSGETALGELCECFSHINVAETTRRGLRMAYA